MQTRKPSFLFDKNLKRTFKKEKLKTTMATKTANPQISKAKPKTRLQNRKIENPNIPGALPPLQLEAEKSKVKVGCYVGYFAMSIIRVQQCDTMCFCVDSNVAVRLAIMRRRSSVIKEKRSDILYHS